MTPRESFDASKKSMNKKHQPKLTPFVKFISVFLSLCASVIIKFPGFNETTLLRWVVGLLSIFGLAFTFKKNPYIRGMLGLENQADTNEEEPQDKPTKHKRNLKSKIQEKLKVEQKLRSESKSQSDSGLESKAKIIPKKDAESQCSAQKIDTQNPVISDLVIPDSTAPDPVEELIEQVWLLNEGKPDDIHRFRHILHDFLERYPNILELCSHRRNHSILHYFVKGVKYEFIRILFEHGAKVDILSTGEIKGLHEVTFCANTTPLMIAARYGYRSLDLLLLNANPQPNLELRDEEGSTALFHAMWATRRAHQDPEVSLIPTVELLLKAGASIQDIRIEKADPTKSIKNAFFFSIWARQTYLIPSFLKYSQLTLESRNENNETLLMYALEGHHYDAIAPLIDLKADLRTINELEPENLINYLAYFSCFERDEQYKGILKKLLPYVNRDTIGKLYLTSQMFPFLKKMMEEEGYGLPHTNDLKKSTIVEQLSPQLTEENLLRQQIFKLISNPSGQSLNPSNENTPVKNEEVERDLPSIFIGQCLLALNPRVSDQSLIFNIQEFKECPKYSITKKFFRHKQTTLVIDNECLRKIKSEIHSLNLIIPCVNTSEGIRKTEQFQKVRSLIWKYTECWQNFNRHAHQAQERKAAAESKEAHAAVVSKIIFYPQKQVEKEILLEKVKRFVLDLKGVLKENKAINEKQCSIEEHEKSRILRLSTIQTESEKIQPLELLIEELELQLFIFKNRLDYVSKEILPKIQNRLGSENILDLEKARILLAQLDQLWCAKSIGLQDQQSAKKHKKRNCLPSIETLVLEIQDKRRLLISVEEWKLFNQKDSKYKRVELSPDSNDNISMLSLQNSKPIKEVKQSNEQLEQEKIEQLRVCRHSGKVFKRLKNFDKQEQKKERLARFKAKRKEEEALAKIISFSADANHTSPKQAGRSSPQKVTMSPALAPARVPGITVVFNINPKESKDLKESHEPKGNTEPKGSTELKESRAYSEEFRLNASSLTNTKGTQDKTGSVTVLPKNEVRANLPKNESFSILPRRHSASNLQRLQEVTLESLTSAGQRAETLEEVATLQGMLIDSACPEGCTNESYLKFDAYGLFLTCAQVMDDLAKRNWIFPNKMAEHFRNVAYHGQLFDEQDYIKKNKEFHEMANALMSFIEANCRTFQTDYFEQDFIIKTINLPLYTKIMEYKIPDIRNVIAKEVRKLCKKEMDKCLLELTELLELKNILPEKKWKGALLFLKARLGTHFAHYERQIKRSDRKNNMDYQYYNENCKKYKKMGALIRHNKMRALPKLKTSGSNLQSDFLSDALSDEQGNTGQREDINSQRMAFQQFMSDCFPELKIKPKPKAHTKEESKVIAESSAETQAQAQPGTILFSNTMRYDRRAGLSRKAQGLNTSGSEVDTLEYGKENGNGTGNEEIELDESVNDSIYAKH